MSDTADTLPYVPLEVYEGIATSLIHASFAKLTSFRNHYDWWRLFD